MMTQAAKAGIFNFFDTLRIELGSSIGGITIVTPSFIESEMLMGKYVSDKGETEWHEDQRDVSPSFIHQTIFNIDISYPYTSFFMNIPLIKLKVLHIFIIM